MIHVSAHAITTHSHFPTVSNIVLVSFTHCRTSALLILPTQLIFFILLQIHISMASNLFLSAWVIDHVSDAYNTTLHNTLFTILFFNSIIKLPMNSLFLFINTCLSNVILHRISVQQYPSAEKTLPKYLNWSTYSTCWPSILTLTLWYPWWEIEVIFVFIVLIFILYSFDKYNKRILSQ